MERAKKVLALNKEESQTLSNLTVNPHRPNIDSSFYEDLSIRGISVDRVEPGSLVCSFIVPPRLIAIAYTQGFTHSASKIAAADPTDRNGNLSSGAIANLVDEVGGSVIYREGLPMNVSVTISISYVSTAKLDDELEVSARLLGQKGSFFGTMVSLKNKATGEIIAEGRHSLFSRHASKI